MKCWSAGCGCQVKFHKLQGGFSATKMPEIEEAALLKPVVPSSGPHSVPSGELAQNQRCPSEPVDPGKALESGVFSESSFQFLLKVEKGLFRDLLVWIKVKETRWLLIVNAFGLSVKIM